jgi:NAD(P)-dependent dehydrogenase (short-subunit alcohol dehydrogenase family)
MTGANGLIGNEVASAFLAYGATVVITDVQSKAEMIQAADAHKKNSPTADIRAYQMDVTSEASVDEVFQALDHEFGKVDVLVNLAAIDAKFDKGAAEVNDVRFENYPLELWERSVDVNSTGLLRVTQHALRRMVNQQKGNVINVASTYSLVAPNQDLYLQPDGSRALKPVDYVATKSMVPNFTRYIATLYAEFGIRCNCIVPHGVDNQHPLPFRENFAKLSPMRRLCDVSELRGPFVFLAAQASSYMTGAVLVVDGGWTAW